MDKLTIIQKADDIQEENVRFYVGGKEAESRFNYAKEGEGKIQGGIEIQAACALYSILTNAIMVKAKGMQACNDALPRIRGFIDNYADVKDADIKNNFETEKGKACLTLENFILSKEKITMAEILARLFPLVVVNLSLSDKGSLDRKTFQTLNRKKEMIFNQATLFSRCIFRSFLSLPDIDSSKIRSDLSAMDKPQFTYENRLVLPIYEDAFTITSFREAIKKAVSSASNRLSLGDCDDIVVVYLLRDFTAEVSLN